MKETAFPRLLVATLGIIAVCSFSPPLAVVGYAGSIVDNFDGASLNTSLWKPFNSPQTQWVQQGGELRIKIGAGSNEGAGLNSKFRLQGDFEMTVDYRLITWPPDNGVRLGFEGPGFSASDYVEFMVKRVSFGPDEPQNPKENYLAMFKEGTQWYGGNWTTADDHGSLKLTRVGSVLTGYFLFNGGWIPIGSHDYATPPGLPGWFAVTLWANGTPSADVEIAFDNFRVSYTTVAFSSGLAPLSLLLLE
jgi:hypothetical protein